MCKYGSKSLYRSGQTPTRRNFSISDLSAKCFWQKSEGMITDESFSVIAEHAILKARSHRKNQKRLFLVAAVKQHDC